MKRKILIVDDEKAFADAVTEYLCDRGYDALATYDVKEALSVYETFAPEVVVTDLKLPDVSGFELLAGIRRKDSGSIVIVMTAYGSVNEASKSLQLHSNTFIQKPIRMEYLARLVKDQLKIKDSSSKKPDHPKLKPRRTARKTTSP